MSICRRNVLSFPDANHLVTIAKKREYITLVLKDLHWLPVESHNINKLMLLTSGSPC